MMLPSSQVKQADPSDLAQLAARWAHTKRVVTPEDTQRSPDRNGQSLATPPRKTNSMTIDYPILGKDFVFAQRCKMCELQSSLRPRKWADWAKRLVLMLRRVHGARHVTGLLMLWVCLCVKLIQPPSPSTARFTPDCTIP
ncbi:hypothetical protein KEM48_009291 [Puccinia striiformis f. sp. tritici PST-130]|nr:hypothetical protein KEM48_009291 [Puccinia striiformis f. sp. tritici PST-130]